MSKPNPYAFLTPLAMKWFSEHRSAEEAAKRPHLTLVTPASLPPKTRNPKMTKTPAPSIQKVAITDTTRESQSLAEPAEKCLVLRKVASQRLADHARTVHNALEAVRSLVLPSHGTGLSPSGLHDDLQVLSRHHFVDLLEIINDRLGAALEMDEV